MAIKRDESQINYEALEAALMTAASKDREMAQKYGYRVKEVDELEDKIISSFANTPEIRLGTNPSLLECINVQAFGQNLLNQLTEIELACIRISVKLSANREAIASNILNALGSAGSAESRRAKASSATEVLNLLLTIEEGLLRICDVARKNLQSAIGAASRAQTALQTEIQYLGGAELQMELQQATRGKLR